MEGDLEGDYKVDFRGKFKQDLEGDLLSSSGQLRTRSGLVQVWFILELKFNSLELDMFYLFYVAKVSLTSSGFQQDFSVISSPLNNLTTNYSRTSSVFAHEWCLVSFSPMLTTRSIP